MIDILRQFGLDIKLDNQNYKLIMDGSLMGAEIDIRKLEQISSVLYDKDVTEPEELYTLYNDVGEPKTRKALALHGLRYDIGVLPPIKIGCEYIKTIGHYHGLEPKSKMPYAEVYEVVHGAAHFILQKQNDESNDLLEDVLFVKAVAGDRLVMPPDYAHVTINPSPEALLLCNIAAADCGLEYEKIVQKGGMGYFNIEENGSSVLVNNDNYKIF